jgi:acetate kinase
MVGQARYFEAYEHHDPVAKLAVVMEAYRAQKYIGAYFAALGRVDALVFIAGCW